jgi:hypothetical protein
MVGQGGNAVVVAASWHLRFTACGQAQVLEAMPDAGHVRLTISESRLGRAWVRGVGLP